MDIIKPLQNSLKQDLNREKIFILKNIVKDKNMLYSEILSNISNSTEYNNLTENNQELVIKLIKEEIKLQKVDYGLFTQNIIESIQEHMENIPNEFCNIISETNRNVIASNRKIVNLSFKIETILTPEHMKKILELNKNNNEGKIYNYYSYNLKDLEYEYDTENDIPKDEIIYGNIIDIVKLTEEE